MGLLLVGSGPDPLPRRPGPAGAEATSSASSSSPSLAPPGLLPKSPALSCRHLGDRGGRGRAPLPHPASRVRAAGTGSRRPSRPRQWRPRRPRPRPPGSRTLTAREPSYVCRSPPGLGTLLRRLRGAPPPRPGELAGRLPQPALVLGVVAMPSPRGRQGNGRVPNPARMGPEAGGQGRALPERRASAEHRAGPRRPAPPPRLLPPGCSRSSSSLAAPPRSQPPQPTLVASSLSACHANPLQSCCHFNS